MMIKLRYFKGGKERREEALIILEKLIISFENDQDIKLRNVLLSYRKELQDNSTSIPIAISRLNVEIAKVISENEIHISDENKHLLKALRDLAYFRLF